MQTAGGAIVNGHTFYWHDWGILELWINIPLFKNPDCTCPDDLFNEICNSNKSGFLLAGLSYMGVN